MIYLYFSKERPIDQIKYYYKIEHTKSPTVEKVIFGAEC